MAGPEVYERLAGRIREMAVEAQGEDGTGAERFKVVQVAPLRIEQVGGDLVLEDGDPDLTIGGWLRERFVRAPLDLGDEVWCLREGTEWHLTDAVVDPEAPSPDLSTRNLTVTGTSHLEGPATLDSTLSVAGPVTLDSSLNVWGGAEVHGAVTLDSTLSVAGSSTLSTVTATGPTTLNSTLHVVGAVTLDSTLSVGSTTVGGNLTVNGTISSFGAGGAQPTFWIDSAGVLRWGAGGSSAPDTDLYRWGTGNRLQTDSTFGVGGALLAQGAGTGLSVTNSATVGNTLNVVGSALLGASGTPGYTLDVRAGNTDGIRILSANSAYLGLESGQAGTRNWAFRTNYNTGGDFVLHRSTTTGGAATTAVMYGDSSGNMTFYGQVAVTNDNGVLTTGSTTGQWAYRAWVSGDAQYRLVVRSDGRLDWGPGSVGSDVSLYRSGAGALRTDGSLTVGGAFTASGGMSVTGDVSVSGNLSLTGTTGYIRFFAGLGSASYTIIGSRVSGDANDRFEINADGTLLWGPGSTAWDTSLFRNGVGALRTNGSLTVAGSAGFVVSANALIGGNLTVQGGTGGGTSLYASGGLSINTGSASYYALAAGVSGDSQNRFLMYSNGTMLWGPGNAALDTNLYRAGVASLKTDSSLYVSPTGGGYGVLATVQAGNTGLAVRVAGDSYDRWNIDASAVKINLGAGSATTDTSLSRVGAGILAVGSRLHVIGGVGGTTIASYSSGSSQESWNVADTGRMNWGPGGTTAPDTNLYRSAAGALKTDGTFTAGNATVGPWVNDSSYMAVAYSSQFGTANNYALLVGSTGETYLNATSGRAVHIRIANSDVVQVSSTTLTLTGAQTVSGYMAVGGYGGSGMAGNGLGVAGASEFSSTLSVGGALSIPSSQIEMWGQSAAGNVVFSTALSTDTQARLSIRADGTMYWGPGGSTALDTQLFRYQAGTLGTGSLIASGRVWLGAYTGSQASSSNGLGVAGASEFQSSLTVQARLTANLGLIVADNSSMYNAIRTNQAAGNLVIANYYASGDTQAAWWVSANGTLSWGVGGSTAVDTNLYRYSAGLLNTDGSLRVGTNLTVVGSTTMTGGVTMTGGPLFVRPAGSGDTMQSTALIGAVNTGTNNGAGNDFEWGHSNTAGYRHHLGHRQGGGHGFLAFNAEAGTNNDTYRTRGITGTVIQGDNAGGLVWGQVANPNADNQALTTTMTLDYNGNLSATGSISATSSVNGSNVNASSGANLHSLSASGLATARTDALYLQYGQTSGQVTIQPAGTSSSYVTFANVTQGYLGQVGGRSGGGLFFDTPSGKTQVWQVAGSTMMTLTSAGQLQVGGNAAQSNALLSAVNAGNSIEFGHYNTAGYHSTIGAESSSGRPFVAFHAEAGTNNSTYRTRGIAGSIFQSDLAGGFVWGKAPGTSADNQAFVQLGALDSSSNFNVWGSYRMNGTTVIPGSATGYTGGGAMVMSASPTLTGSLYLTNTNLGLSQNGGMLLVQTASGYVQIGPGNASWCHIYTDRAGFYFDHQVTVDGKITRYSGNMRLESGSGSGATLDTSGNLTTDGFVIVNAPNSNLNGYTVSSGSFNNRGYSMGGSSYGGLFGAQNANDTGGGQSYYTVLTMNGYYSGGGTTASDLPAKDWTTINGYVMPMMMMMGNSRFTFAIGGSASTVGGAVPGSGSVGNFVPGTVATLDSGGNLAIAGDLLVGGVVVVPHAVTGYTGTGNVVLSAGPTLTGTTMTTGQIYASTTGANAFVMNSTGANYGQLLTTGANTWALAYGTSQTTAGTAVLSWNSSSQVTAAGSIGVTGGYGAVSSVGLYIGGGGASPSIASVAFGDGSGWYLNLGYNASGTFTPRFRFKDSGQLRIGDANAPAYSLDVVGSTSTARFGKGRLLNDSPFLTGFNIDSGSDPFALGTTGAATVNVYTNNTLAATFDTSGNFNITGQYRIGGSQIAASNLSNGTTGTGNVVLSDSAVLTGNPTAVTQPGGTNNTRLATTAFVLANNSFVGSTPTFASTVWFQNGIGLDSGAGNPSTSPAVSFTGRDASGNPSGVASIGSNQTGDMTYNTGTGSNKHTFSLSGTVRLTIANATVTVSQLITGTAGLTLDAGSGSVGQTITLTGRNSGTGISATVGVDQTGNLAVASGALLTLKAASGQPINGAVATTTVFQATTTYFDLPVAGSQYRINGSQIAAADLSNGTTGSGNVVLAAGPTLTGTTTVGTITATTIQVGGTALAASHLSNGTTGTGSVVLASAPTLNNLTLDAGSGSASQTITLTGRSSGTATSSTIVASTVGGLTINAGATSIIFQVAATAIVNINAAVGLSITDGFAIQAGTAGGSGIKIGTNTTQKMAFWNATPVAQPTTAIAASGFTANTGTAVNTGSTFGGYTLQQIANALRTIGLLA